MVFNEYNFFIERHASHVRLFEKEFKPDLDDYPKLKRFLTQNQSVRVEKLFVQRDYICARHLLFACVSNSDEIGAVESLREIIVRKASQHVRTQLELLNLRTQTYYARLFIGSGAPLKMDRLVATLEPEPIVEYLHTVNTREYDALLERVNTFINSRMINEAICELIRGLPYCSDQVGSNRQPGDWYYDFLEACLTSGYTSFISAYIDPDYEYNIANYRASKEMMRKRHYDGYSALANSQIVDNSAPSPIEPRSQADYMRFRQSQLSGIFEPRLYSLYPYQSELVASAHAGKNTIICAPTGSGKTIVATDIAINHLRKARRDNKVARVIMLVPTVPLVEQQTLHFLQYMYGICWVDGISGAETIHNRAGTVLATDLCVMTPQRLISMLNSALRSERLYFTDFTLFIFDECHHVASGSHPYKVLMDMLESANLSTYPQIVGLTASIGAGPSLYDVRACTQHMLKLCSYIKAKTISTVRKNLDNLRMYVIPPADIVERVSRPTNDLFAIRIKETMSKIQKRMTPGLESILNTRTTPLKREDIKFPHFEPATRYQNVVAAMRRNLQKLQNHDERLQMLRSIDHLSHYFYALNISDLLQNYYGVVYLEQKMNSYINPTPIDVEFLNLYETIRNELLALAAAECLEEKGILARLYTILRDQYTRRPESRTLIFVSTRTCAQQIADHISIYLSQQADLPSFYKQKRCVGYITSSNQSASIGGQSAEMQRQMRDQFERGYLKILAVTSVADEGINIMQCNLVIKYNNTGSERTLIQRRGRARAKDSRSILLALDNGVELQEYENVRREAMMYRCIENLQSHTTNRLNEMIEDQTKKIYQIRLRNQQTAAQRRDQLRMRKYLLKCRTCNAKICESMDVRKVNESMFAICDVEIWSRSTYRFTKKPSKDGLITTCARWVCSCNQVCGNIVRYAGAFLPLLNHGAFILERLDTQELIDGSPNYKWARIENELFNIDPISATNISEMVFAANAGLGIDNHRKLEKQEELAKQLLSDRIKKRPDKKVKMREYLNE